MINAVILNQNASSGNSLQQAISSCCPKLNVLNSVFSKKNYRQVIQDSNSKLVFLEVNEGLSYYYDLFLNMDGISFETILIASKRDYVFEAIQYKISGYLLKPINPASLKSTVDIAVKRISEGKYNSSSNEYLPPLLEKIIGVPTMDGYEFLTIGNIIRCESYLKCTRVITKKRSDVISSYNIGEFIKALEKYGFFAPHQSHLINLKKVKKYLKEGTIVMSDNSSVPVSRRRKNDFLNQIPHL